AYGARGAASLAAARRRRRGRGRSRDRAGRRDVAPRSALHPGHLSAQLKLAGTCETRQRTLGSAVRGAARGAAGTPGRRLAVGLGVLRELRLLPRRFRRQLFARGLAVAAPLGKGKGLEARFQNRLL